MTPIDFVLFDGDSSPNTPVIDITTALQEPLVIRSGETEFRVLSYYYEEESECMVLDIEEVE